MAIIHCPECGKEISDKATACIHCGFPLDVAKKVKRSRSIPDLFAQHAAYSTVADASHFFPRVMSEVNVIRQTYSVQEAADLTAKNIIDGLALIPDKVSWMNVKQYCEIIDYDNMTAAGMDYFSDRLYSVLSITKYYSDGSGGYVYITPFFYAACMVLEHGSDSNVEKLMTILEAPRFGTQTGYEIVMWMYTEHGDGNSFQQIAAVQNALSTQKCPVCGSFRVKKISLLNKFASVLLYGFSTSKIGKLHECQSCGHAW